jgi:TolB protein
MNMSTQQMTWRLGIVAVVAAAVMTAPAVRAVRAQAQQPSDVVVVISGDPGTPPRYAVPDFAALTPEAADIAKTIGQVLWDDLNFEREFYMIPRDTYGSVPAARTPEQVPFAAWRELGADAVVFGTVQRTGNDIRIQVRLFNVRTRLSVFAKEYSGTATNPRLYAHTLSDEIHDQQRGLKGIARTKLAWVSDRNGVSLGGTVENRQVKEIYVGDYDGANQRRLTVSRQLNLNPSWSPDARSLAYTTYRPNPDIFVSLIYQGVMQNPTKSVGTNYLPVFSPDGKQIAFMSGRDGNPEIYAMNVDGSNLRRLTNSPVGESSPTWSPSGSQIAFTSDRSGKAQIYVMNSADGSGVRRLTVNESEADRPTWSPPPFNEIAYSASTGPGYDIKVLEVSTGQIRQLTFGEGSNEGPAWAPGGRHVAFTSTRAGGRTQVFTMGRDGRGLRQITREGNNQTPAWSN